MSENLRKDIANILKTDPKNGVERAFSMLIDKIQTLQSSTKELDRKIYRLQLGVNENRD